MFSLDAAHFVLELAHSFHVLLLETITADSSMVGWLAKVQLGFNSKIMISKKRKIMRETICKASNSIDSLCDLSHFPLVY